MSGVKLTSINKVYPNGAHAVRGVDMEINDGEFIVFVGPSGCGKSTLLRMIAGLETITQGTIEIGDRVINDVTPAERDVAMVFQNYALYPHMSVRGNMSYGLKNRGFPKAEIEQKVLEAAKMLRIDDFLDRQPNQLSGGQRQRVAMGRAIVRNPKVFLFDEPLSNLDAKLRVQMRIEIKRLQRQMNVTSVYVTHDQTEAMTLADRLAVINDGRVEQMGAPIELYNDPQTLFVASFIGSPQINLISCKVQDGKLVNNDLVFDSNGVEISSGRVVLGIRPDQLTITEKGPLKLMVDLVEQHGGENLIYGSLQGAMDDQGETLEICLKTDQSVHPAIEEVIPIGFGKESVLLFDGTSGDRIR